MYKHVKQQRLNEPAVHTPTDLRLSKLDCLAGQCVSGHLGIVLSSPERPGIPQETTPVAFQWKILSFKIRKGNNRLMESEADISRGSGVNHSMHMTEECQISLKLKI